MTGASMLVLGGGAATFTNNAGATFNNTSTSGTPIAAQGGVANKSFVNAGTFNSNGGAVQVIDVPTSNTGTLNVNSGTLELTSFPNNAGTLNVVAGATLGTGGAPLTNAGVVGGRGTIDLGGETFFNDGTVAPGASPGALAVVGDFTQGPAGVLAIEIGGVTPGTAFDVLQVTGVANLGGTLTATLVNGFVPAAGNRFDFLTYASRTGDFTAFNLAGLQAQGQAASYALVSPAASLARPPILFNPDNDAVGEAKRLNDRFVDIAETHEMERPKVTGQLCD
jgi:hypothetical protein